jgi:ParB family chromosome partitioning protein
MHRKALGRGLEALIPGASGAAVSATTERTAGNAPLEIPIDDIGPNPHQPRQRFDDEAIKELASSIKASGVLQPVLVRRDPAGGYQLVAGERRLRAARVAGLPKVPAILREVNDQEMIEMALVENIQREDLNPIEEAKAYQSLISRAGLTHDQVSDRVGKQRTTISNSLRLLTLPVEVQDMVSRETLSAGHARALIALPNAGEQLASARYVQSKGFSVRRTEAYIRRKLRRQHTRPARTGAAGLGEWETKLQQKFATQVAIKKGRKGGHVEFEFFSDDDLERLLEMWGVM